jgi:hypothetical protein
MDWGLVAACYSHHWAVLRRLANSSDQLEIWRISIWLFGGMSAGPPDEKALRHSVCRCTGVLLRGPPGLSNCRSTHHRLLDTGEGPHLLLE